MTQDMVTAAEIELEPEPQSIPTHKKTGAKGIPIEAIFDLRSKGLSASAIARHLGCGASNIVARLQDYENTKQYIANKALLIRHLERKVYNAITDEKLQKANAYQLALIYAIIFDKGQLVEGKFTQHIAYADIIAAQAKAKAGLDDLIAEQERRAKLCATECQTL